MKLIVSACLLGQKCKYNGGDNYSERVAAFIKDHEVIPVCPEVEGGLSVPRTPCEIVNGIVTDRNGESRDKEFRKGAEICLKKALDEKADLAVLQSRSPSCGVKQIYDGSFSGRLIDGSGVFAELLKENGIKVLDAEDILIIRRFRQEDAEEVSKLIIETLNITSIKDYSREYLDELITRMQPGNIIYRAESTHFYVAEDGERIIGCGAVGPYWDKSDESSLFNIFVLPEMQGKGIGRSIVRTLEQDEYYLRAKRIEVAASITAVQFYIKLGYKYKAGATAPDAEGLLRMEKHLS